VRLGFADALAAVADPAFAPLPLAAMLGSEYAAARRSLIDPSRAMKEAATGKSGTANPGPDTVYFCVVDGDGNACSFINSNDMGCGTGIVPR
jgi:gamma-glutamyltranspeptidase/glutathione hydrolase